MADSSSSPDSISRGIKKQKLEKGIKILQLDMQISLIEHPAIANNIVPLLELDDALALGSCSKYLNGLCECKTTWKDWYKKRWGPIADSEGDSKGWKRLYSQQHKKKRNKVFETLGPVISSMVDGELYSHDFLREVEQLKQLNVTFVESSFFLFRKDLDVSLNLVGLYYCFFELRVPADDILKSIVRCQLADRQACVSWCYPKNWSYGFYLPEVNFTKIVSLREILENSQSNVLFIFKEAAIQTGHEKQLSKVRVSGKIPEIPKSEPEEPSCGECEGCKRNAEIFAEKNKKSGEVKCDDMDVSGECDCQKCKGNESYFRGQGVTESDDESEEPPCGKCEACKTNTEILAERNKVKCDCEKCKGMEGVTESDDESEEPPCGKCEACKRNAEILAERNKVKCDCEKCKGMGDEETDESGDCECEKCKGNNESDSKGKEVMESEESDEGEEVGCDCEKCMGETRVQDDNEDGEKGEMEVEGEGEMGEKEMACDGGDAEKGEYEMACDGGDSDAGLSSS